MDWSVLVSACELASTAWVKALVLDDGKERICFVTLDLMCADRYEFLATIDCYAAIIIINVDILISSQPLLCFYHHRQCRYLDLITIIDMLLSSSSSMSIS